MCLHAQLEGYYKKFGFSRSNTYFTFNTNGISLLFDQKKLLNLIKALSAFKGSSTLSAVGSIANNYDGMQVGFEMTK